jgi:hypothetical protein
MKTFYKISFSLLLFMFVAFVMGQGIVNCSVYEKVKTENSSNIANSFASCDPECSGEEDVTFYVQPHSGHILTDPCQNMSLPVFNLPPVLCYPVWLPPDNS